jgi:hypothetical protein
MVKQLEDRKEMEHLKNSNIKYTVKGKRHNQIIIGTSNTIHSKMLKWYKIQSY